MDHAGKAALLTAGRDIAQLRGLEIGPRHAPLIGKHAGHVLYADYADTETVRRNASEVGVAGSAVHEVDIVTGGGRIADATDQRFDYAVASHVAEHVPDLLGWLADLASVLEEDGTLGLAIPDRRFTFDRFRQESTIAEAIEAYLLRATKPSLRQIFDSAWPSVEYPVEAGWRNETPEHATPARRMARLPSALNLVRRVHASGVYNDAHCWVFTPERFLDLAEQAAQMDLLPFTLARFVPTELGGYEFYAVLARQGGADRAAILRSIEDARAVLRASDAERHFAAAHEPQEMQALRRENAALRESLDAMRNATVWRATAPVRRIMDGMRRRR